jgi:hypothetical protein
VEDLGRHSVYATLVRILSKDMELGPELVAKVNRLVDDDPDFSWLAKHWPEERRFSIAPRIGAEAESLDEFRNEIERLKVYEDHPTQQFRYELLYTGVLVTFLWPALTAALDSADFQGYALALQLAIVVLVLGVSAFFAWGIATRSARADFYKIVKPDLPRHRWLSLLSLAGILFVIVLFATLGFAALSELLYFHGIATTTPPEALDDPLFDSILYYLWGFLNAVEIPQTLGWELDVLFTDRLSPVLLLAYKLAVILPAIAMARLAWKARRVSRT